MTTTDRIETRRNFLWLDDGILHVESKGGASTPETVSETMTAMSDLVSAPVPILMDVRIPLEFDASAWKTFIDRISPVSNAIAVVVDPDNPPDTDAVDRSIVPFRLFTATDDALAFLNPHRTAYSLTIAEDATVTRAGAIWAEAGTLRIQSFGRENSRTTVSEAFEVIASLTAGTRMPLLIDIVRWPQFDAGAWTEVWAKLGDFVSVAAVIVDPANPPPIDAFIETLNRVLLPVKLVTSEEEGLEFLRSHDPETDVRSTTTTSIWIDHGIVWVQAKGLESSRETVERTLDHIRDISGGVPAPVLFDARITPKMDAASWQGFIAAAQAVISRVAVVVDPQRAPDFGEYPSVVNEHVIPFQTFESIEEATTFLIASD